ncbi:MAG: glutamate--tRNA ligase family protein, partial [Pseudobdellovibrionaceae bacterium]|nr:glutamate--tRNA ligase family protein [Pseudobdellovibrionaceae bacterium]
KGATSCHEFKLEGYLPQALNNFLVLLGWSHPQGKEIMSLEEMISGFSLERLNPAGAVFDPVKLKWMNGQYMRSLPTNELVRLFKEYLTLLLSSSKNDLERLFPEMPEPKLRDWVTEVGKWDIPKLEKNLDAVRTSSDTLWDLLRQLTLFSDVFFDVTPESQEVLAWPSTAAILNEWRDFLLAKDERGHISVGEFNLFLDHVKQKFQVKGKHLFMPLRVAVLGRPHGMELGTVIPLLSCAQLLNRVTQVLNQKL